MSKVTYLNRMTAPAILHELSEQKDNIKEMLCITVDADGNINYINTVSDYLRMQGLVMEMMKFVMSLDDREIVSSE